MRLLLAVLVVVAVLVLFHSLFGAGGSNYAGPPKTAWSTGKSGLAPGGSPEPGAGVGQGAGGGGGGSW